MNLLTVDQLSVDIHSEQGKKTVLHTVSFTVKAGEVLAVVGESGSGKSICAQAIMGLLPKPACRISNGDIRFNEHSLLDPQVLTTMRGSQIAMIFQEPVAALNPVHTVHQQLAEVFRLHRPALTRTERDIALRQILAEVGLNSDILPRYPHQLSGGQCQRVTIAMALAGEPKLLIADEPSTALDTVTQQQILQLLRELQQQRGLAVIFITHDLSLVANWCNRVAVLRHGEVCELAPTAQLFAAAQHPYTRSLLAALKRDANRQPQATSETLLSLKALNQHYGSRKLFGSDRRLPVLQDITLDIQRGETLALVGQSGSGKSTLGKTLLMLTPPSSGTIVYRPDSADAVVLNTLGHRALAALRAKLQIVFQDTADALNPRHSIEKILTEPLLIHTALKPAQRRLRALELLELVGLPADSLDRYPHEFSGGQRQRINIARAVALEPELLVCDEALSALDVTTQAQILALLSSLKQQLQLTLLFISHDLACVRHFADRVCVLDQGRIAELGATASVLQHAQHPATQRLLAAEPQLPFE